MENQNNAPQNEEQKEQQTPQANTSQSDNSDALVKAQAEIARLGKLVNSYAEKEKTAKEEEAKKKGEFEKLFNEKNTELESLTTAHNEIKTKNEAYEAHFKASYEAEVAKLSDEQKTLVEELLSGKSDFEKFSLLPKIVAQISPQNKSFGGTPQGGQPPKNTPDQVELLKKGDFATLLKLRNGGSI